MYMFCASGLLDVTLGKLSRKRSILTNYIIDGKIDLLGDTPFHCTEHDYIPEIASYRSHKFIQMNLS